MRSIKRPVWGRAFSIVVVSTALAMAILAVRPVGAQSGGGHLQWVGTWATAPVGRPQNPATPAAPAPGQPAPAVPAPFLHFSNQTLRQIVHTSFGGERVRVVLSNAYGTAPLTVGGAHVALRDKEAAIVPQADRPLTFGGRPSVVIPAGAVVFSDAVGLTVPPLADLAIDLYLPESTYTPSPLTVHTGAQQTNYVSPAGNHAGETVMPVMTTTSSWFLLTRVEVMAPETVGAIVAFGDSITDGTNSTSDTNNRWPDHLARRLVANNIKMAALNAGIGGNRVLGDGGSVNALARLDRDVLTQTGVKFVVFMMGINDIRQVDSSPGAADLIAAHQQIIERAHARGLKIYGATLTPFEGNRFTPEREAKRQALNQWIRTGKMYDAVIDFDAITRDPAQPTKFLPAYDSGDHLHPGPAGYKAMADSIDLGLFMTRPADERTVAVERR